MSCHHYLAWALVVLFVLVCVVNILLLNCHALFKLTKKLALQVRLLPLLPTVYSTIAVSLCLPRFLDWGWAGTLTLWEGEWRRTKQPKSKTTLSPRTPRKADHGQHGYARSSRDMNSPAVQGELACTLCLTFRKNTMNLSSALHSCRARSTFAKPSPQPGHFKFTVSCDFLALSLSLSTFCKNSQTDCIKFLTLLYCLRAWMCFNYSCPLHDQPFHALRLFLHSHSMCAQELSPSHQIDTQSLFLRPVLTAPGKLCLSNERDSTVCSACWVCADFLCGPTRGCLTRSHLVLMKVHPHYASTQRAHTPWICRRHILIKIYYG